jgi:UDP-N-acetylmuramyl pentapeptide phosphotransferase/UDP-N-acetylglucosamine-1-phosphate transferase
MYALLALVSLLIAAGSFYYFQIKDGGTLFLVLGAVFGILFILFGVLFMSNRVNKTEDIHITE